MIDIRCSRNSSSCAGCPIIECCDYIEVTEEIDPHSLYEKGRTDVFNKILSEMRKTPFANEKAMFVKKYIDEQLKENANG